MADKHPNERTTIIIQPSSWSKRTYDVREEESARRLIREEVLLKKHEPYYQARAKIKRNPDGTVDRIVAYLLRANTYTADVVEIKTTDSYGVVSIKEGPDVVDIDDDDVAHQMSRSPIMYADVDMVCATPVPDIPSAKKAVLDIAEIARGVGLRVRVLCNPGEASIAAYQSALASGVRAFFSVGHGYTSGIVLADGNLTVSWFNGLTGRPLSPAVVEFNSCQVFNPPLQPAIMSTGARTFVGGKINLLIGPSEAVSTEFWRRILTMGEEMGRALQAAQQTYPTPGAFGISGDLGVFGTTVNQAIFFEHANYVGRSRALGIGRYDLNQIGLPNDCISSLRVPGGLKVTLFQHAGFGGNSITFTESATYVGSFNDQTSSIVIEPASHSAAVDIYEHNDFQGMRKQLGIGRYNISDMGLPNDCLSSIRVGTGLKATLFENKDFTGSSVSYVKETSSVGSFNDKTSSIVVEPVRVQVAECFEDANFCGRCSVLGIGDYNMTQIGLPNDCLSSLRVPNGLEVVLYEHANFAGSSIRYTQSTSFVGSFNDKTSSIRVRPRLIVSPHLPVLPHNEAIHMKEVMQTGTSPEA